MTLQSERIGKLDEVRAFMEAASQWTSSWPNGPSPASPSAGQRCGSVAAAQVDQVETERRAWRKCILNCVKRRSTCHPRVSGAMETEAPTPYHRQAFQEDWPISPGPSGQRARNGLH